jgi:ankyrin repeat protein
MTDLLLRRGADVTAKDGNGDTACEFSLPRLNTTSDQALISHPEGWGEKVHRAPLRCGSWTLTRLLAAGGDLEARNNAGFTPLIHTVSSSSVDEPRLKSLKLLLDAGADPNARDSGERTALHILTYRPMCERHMLQAAKILVGRGIDVNARDNKGRTALERLVPKLPSHATLVEFLVQHGAVE